MKTSQISQITDKTSKNNSIDDEKCSNMHDRELFEKTTSKRVNNQCNEPQININTKV